MIFTIIYAQIQHLHLFLRVLFPQNIARKLHLTIRFFYTLYKKFFFITGDLIFLAACKIDKITLLKGFGLGALGWDLSYAHIHLIKIFTQSRESKHNKFIAKCHTDTFFQDSSCNLNGSTLLYLNCEIYT